NAAEGVKPRHLTFLTPALLAGRIDTYGSATGALPRNGRTQEMEGGARALALEPVRESASRGASSRQTTLLMARYGAAQVTGSGEPRAPGLALTHHNTK